MEQKGTVYLVGAGPGDAGLLTLRGAELLARADVVVYDALVNTDLLRLAPREAEVIYGGKRARDHALTQEQLNEMLVAKAREGKCVVRLKGGDPYVFGRGAEEAEELEKAGIAFEVVPGISSIVAGPNYAGIPITHREHNSVVTVFTGHEDPNKLESSLDYRRIAEMPGTKVIVMGTERIGQIADSLIHHGMAKDTPVGIVRWGTTGRQQSVQGTLATIAGIAAAKEFTAPAVTVIGDVVKLRDKLNWFEHRPLFGQRIVVTRTREQASQLSRQLLELGAEVLEIPTIKIVPPDNKQDLMDALLGLGEYDWIVFTSPNGVDAFFDYFFKAFEDLRDIGGVRIAAVGAATASKLRELHLKVDLMPDEYVTRKIISAFRDFKSIENLRFLLVRAQVANQELPKALEEAGGIIDDVALYKTVPETEDRNGAAARFAEAGADWMTFTSSSTVQNFHARFNLPLILKQYPKTRIASIGPETSKALIELGIKPTVQAKEHTIDGLVQALRQHRHSSKP